MVQDLGIWSLVARKKFIELIFDGGGEIGGRRTFTKLVFFLDDGILRIKV